jgi:hypothetical protein
LTQRPIVERRVRETPGSVLPHESNAAAKPVSRAFKRPERRRHDMEAAKAWLAQLRASGPRPSPNLGLVMGPDFAQLAWDCNLMAGRLGILAVVFEAPPITTRGIRMLAGTRPLRTEHATTVETSLSPGRRIRASRRHHAPRCGSASCLAVVIGIARGADNRRTAFQPREFGLLGFIRLRSSRLYRKLGRGALAAFGHRLVRSLTQFAMRRSIGFATASRVPTTVQPTRPIYSRPANVALNFQTDQFGHNPAIFR